MAYEQQFFEQRHHHHDRHQQQHTFQLDSQQLMVYPYRVGPDDSINSSNNDDANHNIFIGGQVDTVLSTESLCHAPTITLAGDSMNDIAEISSTTKWTATKSIPIPIQRPESDTKNNNRRTNGLRSIDDYYDDSSDDDDYGSHDGDESPFRVGEKQLQSTTPLDYSVTSASSFSSNFIDNKRVAKSLPSRTILLRAPYLGSRKSSPSALMDDDDDDDDGGNFYFDRPISSNKVSFKNKYLKHNELFLPPPQQSEEDDFMTGSLLKSSSSKVSAYGSLRESQLGGRFISRSYFDQDSTTVQMKPKIGDYDAGGMHSSSIYNLAASAPVQLSIGERMQQSRLLRQQQQKIEQEREQLPLYGNKGSYSDGIKKVQPSFNENIKARSCLGELLLETESSPYTSGKSPPANKKLDNASGMEQLLLNSSPLVLGNSLDGDDQISSIPENSESNRRDDIDTNVASLANSLMKFDLNDVECKQPDHSRPIPLEDLSPVLSKSLTGLDILRLFKGQQQKQRTTSPNAPLPTTRVAVLGTSLTSTIGTMLPPSSKVHYNKRNSMQQYSQGARDHTMISTTLPRSNYLSNFGNEFEITQSVDNATLGSSPYVLSTAASHHDVFNNENPDTIGAFDLDL